MGLSQALSTGVSGLMNHQKALDNIGNNLANVNTIGYKKGVFQFSTLMEQALRAGMGANDSRGSVNPMAIGMGTQTGSIKKLFTQGNLDTTLADNDMAIWGNGFFVLSDKNGSQALTRDGSFYVSQDGYLMGGAGLFVQGTMAVKRSDGTYKVPQDAKLENIHIPLESTGGMAQTTKVTFSGNLNSDQEVATGLRLFGTKNPPNVNSLQHWMEATNFNKTDDTWTALQDESYIVRQEMLDYLDDQGVSVGVNLAGNVSTYTSKMEIDNDYLANTSYYYALDLRDGQVKAVYSTDGNGNKIPANGLDLMTGAWAAGTPGNPPANPVRFVPASAAVETINGGNVQTSTAMGQMVPEFYTLPKTVSYQGQDVVINNSYTYPPWFYEANGGDFLAAAAVTDAAIGVPPDFNAVTVGWPHGFQGTQLKPGPAVNSRATMPMAGEVYPATLDTPLEHLYGLQGRTWTHLFPNIKDGDEVTIAFDKGNSRVEGTFIYNVPGTPQPFGIQQKVDIERSYTLEHLLKFMGGDVNKPGTACETITPAMFGATPTVQYPEGDPATFPDANARKAYEDALKNVNLAKSDSNFNTTGGIMGLVDLPPNIDSYDYGTDPYSSPIETAGAFTREGVSQVEYTRWNHTLNKWEDVKMDSFNVSFVSNLGESNALNNITISYNNVNNKTLFASETQYAAPQGGSSTATVTFYDSLGNPKVTTLRLTLVSEENNFTTWRWYADCEDDTDFPWQVDPNTGEIISSAAVGTGLIRFDTDGNFVPGSDWSETNGILIDQMKQGVNSPVQIKIINGLNPNSTQDLDFSLMTCCNAKNDLAIKEQDGSAPGTLKSFTVSADGTISGVYSTGKVVELAKIVIATVTNMHGLNAGGDNLYYTTPASGQAMYGFPETGGRGEIKQGQLENSNVDLSEEFTKMISVERGYQANSRVITTADNMLQELLGLVG